MTELDIATLQNLRIARELLDRIKADPQLPFGDSTTTETSESTEISESTEASETSESSENKEGKDGTEDTEGSEASESSEDTEHSEDSENSEETENSEDTENAEDDFMRLYGPLIHISPHARTLPEYEQYVRDIAEMSDVLARRYTRTR